MEKGFGTTVVCFFQAEDGIRDAQESRGLGDVYKRQLYRPSTADQNASGIWTASAAKLASTSATVAAPMLSLIHI